MRLARQKVFISYGSEDIGFVNKLVADLKKQNLKVWHDERLEVGDELAGVIEEELADADYFLVVLTDTSVKKKWVKREYLKALELEEKHQRPRVIPLLRGDVGRPVPLMIPKYADFRKSYEIGLRDLRWLFKPKRPDDKDLPPPHEVPPPYGEVSRPGPPSSLPVFSAVVARSHMPPIDLGTAWGLQRSSFIGICSGSDQQEIYDGLNNLERALFEAAPEEPAAPTLSLRWWLQIDPSLYPNGPQSVAEVWSGLKDKSDDRARYLEDRPLPGSVIPGFLIDVDATDKEALKQSTNTVRLWCDALVNRVFPDRQLSIVVHVTGAGENTQQLAKSVLNELSSPTVALPLEAFYSAVEVRDREETQNSKSAYHNPDPLAAPTNDSTGAHFCSWILQIHTSKENWPKLEQYRGVIKLYKFLKGSESPNDHSNIGLSHPDDVVADLDQLQQSLATSKPSTFKEDFDQQFLELVRDCLPEHLPALIWAYAHSNRAQAWRQALLLAIRENLLESGAEGSDSFLQRSLKVGSDPDERYRSLLHADATLKGSIVDRLVQRLLRSYMQTRSAETESLLKSVVSEPGLSPATKAVCKLFLGQITLRDFLRSEGREAHLIAFCSGYDYEFSLTEVDYVDIDNVDLWLLIASLPASKKRIGELLQLGRRERAVFALINPDEWQEMQSDQGLLTKIAAARQERVLFFRS